MGNWYKEINFEIKDNTNTINTIVEWLSNNYIIDKNCLKVNKKANSFDYYGNEFNIGISLKDKPHCLVLPKELFKDLTINFPQCIYDATASIENNNCSVNEEYFISDYDIYVPHLNPMVLGEYPRIEDLNTLAEGIENLSTSFNHSSNGFNILLQ